MAGVVFQGGGLGRALRRPAQQEDAYVWLEEVEGERALRWAAERSEATLGAFEALPVFDELEAVALEALSSSDRIAHPTIQGDRIYNYWTDADHPAGRHMVEVALFEGARGRCGIEILVAEPVAVDPAERVVQLTRIYDGDDRPGGVVGVVRDGRLSSARAFGMANLAHSVPWETGTVSDIGSVSKQFTAMALLLLEADGLLALDDDVRLHVPELPDFGTPVTLRHFLNYTSGYREIYKSAAARGLSRRRLVRAREGDSGRPAAAGAADAPEHRVELQQHGLHPPVLDRGARVRTAVSGLHAGARVRAAGHARHPVKMVQGEVIPGSAQGYVPVKSGTGWRTARDLPASAGAGGIYATAADLARWTLNYRDASPGGPAAVREMATAAVLENGDTTTYGLGLGIGELSGRTVYAHTGGDVAHRAYLSYFPELDADVVAMSNNASFDLGLGVRIAQAFFADELAETEDEEQADAEEGDGDEQAGRRRPWSRPPSRSASTPTGAPGRPRRADAPRRSTWSRSRCATATATSSRPT